MTTGQFELKVSRQEEENMAYYQITGIDLVLSNA